MQILEQINIGPRTLLKLDQPLNSDFVNHTSVQIGEWIFHDVMYPRLYDEYDKKQVLMLNEPVTHNLVGCQCVWLAGE